MQTLSNWRQRFSQASRGAQIGIVLGAVMLSCVLCGCVSLGGVVALGNTLPALPTATTGAAIAARPSATSAETSAIATLTSTATSSTTPAASATATATVPRVAATATPKPLIVTGATLGGPDSAFQSKYGPASDDLWDVNGVTFSTNLDMGVDGQQHVFGMLVYKSNATTWTQAQAEPICRAFLPPDAVHVKDTHDGSGNVEQVYTSARLAATFPSTSKIGYDPSGTVSITYEVANGGVFQCSLYNDVL